MKKIVFEGLLHRSEFCSRLGIVAHTARNWELRGYGPRARRIGGRIYYSEAEVDRFIQDLRDGVEVPAAAAS